MKTATNKHRKCAKVTIKKIFKTFVGISGGNLRVSLKQGWHSTCPVSTALGIITGVAILCYSVPSKTF